MILIGKVWITLLCHLETLLKKAINFQFVKSRSSVSSVSCIYIISRKFLNPMQIMESLNSISCSICK